MKVVDAFSGQSFDVPSLGTTTFATPKAFPSPHGPPVKIKAVTPGIFSAKALVSDGSREQWVPLVVRFFHPGFPGQHVAFFPS